jgi:hypothetical protein
MMNRKIRPYFLFTIFSGITLFLFILTNCKKEGNTEGPENSKIKVPTINTLSPSAITANSASSGGNITSDGGAAVTARGVCWSTGPTPLLSDNKTTDGTGTGSFTSSLTGLFQGTTYYVRAYATNSAGTASGIVQSFTTSYLPTDPSYFPIGVWLQDPVKNGVSYKNNGINTFVGLWNELDEPQFNALKNANLKVICAQNAYGLSLGSEPLVMGWMHGDEPDNAQWNAATQKYDPCIDPNIIISDYRTIKHNDPSRPVYLNLGQGVAYNNYVGRGACRNNLDTYKVSTNGYLVGCDIASFDIYPVNNTDGTTNGKLEYVAMGIQNLISWSENKPSWCWIETTRISDSSPRRPTTSEVRSEVWMALIHGAQGFGYFCHSFVTGATDEAAMLHDPEMISAVKAINDQITALASVLNSPTTNDYATVISSNTSVPVDMMTKSYGGANYIFAIAMRNGETTASFSVSSGSNVEVFGEGRAITISNGKFSDSFSPYSVHLYKITH